MKKTLGLFMITILIAFASCEKSYTPAETPKADTYSSDFLHKWIDLHLSLIKSTSGYTPPVSSRTMGYTYLALYESVVPGIPTNKSLNEEFNIAIDYPKITAGETYHWPACGTAAVAFMYRSFFPQASSTNLAKIDSLEALDSTTYRALVSQEILDRSLKFGRDIAAAVYEWSRTDGGENAQTRNYPSTYTPPTGAGFWTPTPSPVQPAFHFKSAMQPYWGDNRPFLYENVASSLILAPPPSYSTDTNSYFYQQCKAVYDQGLNNTNEQITIARFWSDDVGTYSPPGHSLAITKIILDDQNANLALASEVLAKIGIAVADAFINCFKNKYIYNFVRPVTYIQTNIDNTWNTLIGTPPFPEYASCHSTQSGAAAKILTHYFGANTGFTDNSKADAGFVARTFSNFYEFADEAAISRFYGGVHYQFSCSLGVVKGKELGQNVLNFSFEK